MSLLLVSLGSSLLLLITQPIQGSKAQQSSPYLVSIEINGKLACAGALINRDWVVTTASCVYGIPPQDITLRAGSRRADNIAGQARSVSQLIVHDHFNWLTNDYDLATVKASRSFKFGKQVRAITIAAEPPRKGQKLVATGWGENKNGKEGSLKRMTMTLKPLAQCQQELKPQNLTDRMLCAVSQSNQVPCWGDFGDPLVNHWNRLVGFFSWSRDCGSSPSIFTNIQFYKQWVLTAVS